MTLLVADRTYDTTYTLYRLRERLSSGVMLYVETGKMDEMVADGDSPNIIHSFTGPTVLQGGGTSTTGTFLDDDTLIITLCIIL